MHLHDPVGDRQTESGAARFARTGLISAVKAFENVRQIFVIDANTGIANLDARASRSVRKTHFNASAGRRVLHGVIENNQNEALDRGKIALKFAPGQAAILV